MASNADTPVTGPALSSISRYDFATDFFWGAATSAYQVEGAYVADGKSYSNWDVYSMTQPEQIKDGTNGCVAIDHYAKFKQDVKLMKKLGLTAYRFSISWSRVLPGGRLSTGVNREAICFYNALIDALLEENIEPFVTLFHFDVPNILEQEYGGFLNKQAVNDFAEYAEVCFFEFGDRVKHWITLNEPWSFTHNGYITGNFPPNHGSDEVELQLLTSTTAPPRYRNVRGLGLGRRSRVRKGNPSTEPYTVAHNLILAHAKAVDVYRKHYQAVQAGTIGVTNMTTWYDPLDENSSDDIAAASRAVDFMWGWFVAPITLGDYPPVMRERVGDRLPKFTENETALVKGSYDFLGLNYYTSNYAYNKPNPEGTTPTYYTDQEVGFETSRDGVPIGEQAGSEWLFVVPPGIYKLLVHTKTDYNDPLIYITENGVDEKNDVAAPLSKALKDPKRIKYVRDHLIQVKKAIDQDQVDVKGYFYWSMFDNYEWTEGYSVRFGMVYIDYVNSLDRYPKSSAIWYMNFLQRPKTLLRSKRQIEQAEESESTQPKRIRNR